MPDGPAKCDLTMMANVKALEEIVMVLLCLLFWVAVLPLAGLWKIGVRVADEVDEQVPGRLMTRAAHWERCSQQLDAPPPPSKFAPAPS